MRRPDVFGVSARSRAWLWAACAALLVLIYLTLWTLYGMTHVSAYARYQQLAPGASATQHQADFRLLSLVRAPELAAQRGDPQVAAAHAVWVVATLEVVQRAVDPGFLCSTELLGPDGRVWEPGSVLVSRAKPQYCSTDDLRLGRPYVFEQTYEVPERYADQVAGVVLVNHLDAKPNLVLTPPR
jgi:hypothetical protein